MSPTSDVYKRQDFIYNPVAKPAKSVIHHPDPFMAGIHQPFYMQVIAAAHQYLATDEMCIRDSLSCMLNREVFYPPPPFCIIIYCPILH